MPSAGIHDALTLSGDMSSSGEADNSGGVHSGVARAVQARTEEAGELSVLVWTFRVEQYDSSGNRLPPIPVELRGTSFEGAISDGDEVEVQGRWSKGRTLRAKRVVNLTTGAAVEARGTGKLAVVFAVMFVLTLVAGVAIFVIVAYAAVTGQAIAPPAPNATGSWHGGR